MSYRITVVNRTGMTVWTGVDGPYVTLNGNSYGYQGNAQLAPATSREFVVSGTGPYRVGFVTVTSGHPSGEQNPNGTPCVLVYNVVPNATVTVASELGMPAVRSDAGD